MTDTTTNTGTTHSVGSERLDMSEAVDEILMQPEDIRDDAPEGDEVTAAEAATTSKSETNVNLEANDDSSEGADSAPEDEAEAEETEVEEGDEQDVEAAQAEDAEEPEELEEPEVVFTAQDGSEVNLEELKRGYLRQADYTKKTQEVAEGRKAIESQMEAVAAYNDKLAENLSLALNVIEPQLSEFATLNWDQLASDDPYEYTEKRALFDQAQARYAQIQQASQQTLQVAQMQQAEAGKQHLAQERQKLAMLIPEMADKVEGTKLANRIREYSLSLGLSEAEASNITDHRLIGVLNKARLYDEMDKGRATAQQKKVKKQATKSLKSGTPTSKSEHKAQVKSKQRKQLQKSGSVDDAVDWMLSA